MTDRQALAAELGPVVTGRLVAYMRQYTARAAATESPDYCPRCRRVTDTKTAPLSTYLDERTCRVCGYVKR